MKKQQEFTPEEINTYRVQLKPVWGIRPEFYAPLIWIILAVLLIFFLFFYPGIKQYGAKVVINSFPENAAVYVDEHYLGVTPWEGFIPAGTRTITVSKHGFRSEKAAHKITGQLFFSLFYRWPMELQYALSGDGQPEKVIETAIARYAQQSGIVSTSLFPYQPVLGDAAYALAFMGEGELIQKLLTLALPHIESSNQWYDFLRGVHVYSLISPGNQVLQLADLFLEWSKKYPAILSFANVQIPGIITDEVAKVFEQAGLSYHKSLQQASAALRTETKTSDERVSIEGIEFRKIQAGTAAFGYPFSNQSNLAYIDELPEYYVMEYELRKKDFLRFLAENPQWQPSNIDTLVQNALVTENYLKNMEELEDDDAIPFISWYAADAVATWLTSKLDNKAMQVRLPYETEWEYAAMVYGEIPSLAFFTNLWEWTQAWHVAVPALANPRESFGYEKTVRGGSQYTPETNYTVRGSQPPDWCTPSLGARFVLIARE